MSCACWYRSLAFGCFVFLILGMLPPPSGHVGSELVPRFGKVALVDLALMSALGQVGLKMFQFNPQELSNLAWAFAAIMAFDDPLFESIAQRAVEIIQEFDAQNVSNSFWAFASLILKDDDLIDALSVQASCLMEEFTMQELANAA